MIGTQYILLIAFTIVFAIFFRPKKKYKDHHLLLLGVVISVASILGSILFGRDIIEVILLEDTWGPGRVIMVGYAVTMGVSLRMVVKVIISRVR